MQSLSVFLDITKFPNFWWKKCWYQQNLRGVSHDLYLIFFRKCITVSSFIIVADFKGRGFYWPLPTHRWTALKRPNLNRVKQLQNEDLNFCFGFSYIFNWWRKTIISSGRSSKYFGWQTYRFPWYNFYNVTKSFQSIIKLLKY